MLILLIVAFFLIIALFGLSVLKSLLNIRSIVYLIPFSFVFGLSSFLVLLYGLAYFLGIFKGSVVAILWLFLSSIFLILRSQKVFFRFENPFNRIQLSILFSILLFIFFFTYLISEKWVVLDFKFHISIASYFVNSDKFPQGVSNWPSLFIPYHYGFDLLSAAIVKLTKISVVDSFRLIVLVSSLVVFLSSFAISNFFLSHLEHTSLELRKNNFLCSLFGALFFYFSGNLLWLDALVRFLLKLFPVDQNWSLFQALCSLGLHGSMINDVGSGGVLFASMAIGLPYFLLLLFLFLVFLDENRFLKRYLILIFIVSLALFHTAEWILYIFLLALVPSFFFYLLLNKGVNKKNIFAKHFSCLIIFTSIIVLNGIAYRILNQGYTFIPGFLELSINPSFLSVETFGRFGNLNEHRNINLLSWDFLSEFGLQFIFLLFVILWLLRNKFKFLYFIISFLFISFISPFVLYMKTSPPDVLRLFHPGFEILSLLFSFWLFMLKDKLSTLYFRSVINFTLVVVILPCILKLVLSGIFSPSIYLNYAYISLMNSQISELIQNRNLSAFVENLNSAITLIKKNVILDDSDKKISDYLTANSKVNDYGLSSYPLPFDFVGIPCYSAIRGSSLPRKITYITLLKTLDPYLIKELSIRWLLLEGSTASVINSDALNSLIQGGFLKEVLRVTNSIGAQLGLYEFNNLEKYIKTNSRKTYWTFFNYLSDDLIPVVDSRREKVICLFKSEKEATSFLKRQIKMDPAFKNYKPFVDAMKEDILKQTESNTGIKLMYM
ncbi:MAG: hypothetical protein HYY52_06120 [Candidatus Melainabacteria bacterium]|nr:hypothetical protein [Candidatus Melainabacteria bacterium]